MLPSKGYFSKIPCVFYLGEGCGRPCCHYRHSVQDVISSQEDARPKENESNSLWSGAQINLVTKLVEKAVDKAFQEEPGGNMKIVKEEMMEVTLKKVLQDRQAVKWALSNKKCHNEVVPSYKPTPIAKLNNRHIPVVCVPSKPIPNANQFRSFRASTPAYFNRFDIDDASYGINGLPHYTGCSNARFTYGLSEKATELKDDQETYNEDMDCFSPHSMEDSKDFAADIQARHCSQSPMEFKSTFSEEKAFGASPSGYQSMKGMPVQYNVHGSVNYVEVDQNTGTNFTTCSGTGAFDDNISHQSEVRKRKSTQTNKGTSAQNRTINHNNVTMTLGNAGSSSTLVCSQKNETAKSSKKSSKGKPSFHTECSQIEGNVEESRRLKRSDSDQTSGRFPAKKLKASTNTKLGNSSLLQQMLLTVEPTTRFSEPHSDNLEDGGVFKESIDGMKKGNTPKKPQTTRNNLHVTSSSDPFTRWMKNKKIREIFGKNKIRMQTTNNISGRDQKHNVEKINSSQNPVIPCTIENEDSEPFPVPKFTPRVAHKKYEVRPYPTVLDCIKIPLSYRQHFCDAFFQEFKKSMGVEEAKSEAERKELEVAKGSGVKSYRNHGSLQLMKLRKNGCIKDPEVKEDVTLDPSSCPDFTYGWSLYRCFSKYLLSEAEMKENGFPMLIPGKPNCAFVEKSARKYSKEQPNKPSIRICANCSEEFEIDKDGVPLLDDNCFYHWGKLRRVREMGQWMEKFTCCDGFGDSAPCESSIYHVWSGRNEDCMEDFIETTKLPSYMAECDAGIYAMDCEMCYTTKGLELARLTVIDLNENVVFDRIVSLSSPVLSYCTRFSGIDERKIREATYTFDDVRAWVLEHFFDKTILIGHSLENDLKALKLFHKTVIDTSVTFPHKFGPPNRMSLKHLASSLLKINIQEDEGGHDSREDAVTCLRLMKMKIREDSKVRKPRIIIGYIGKKR